MHDVFAVLKKRCQLGLPVSIPCRCFLLEGPTSFCSERVLWVRGMSIFKTVVVGVSWLLLLGGSNLSSNFL